MRIPTPVAVGVGLSTLAMYSISAVSSPAAAAAPPTSVDASTSAAVLHLGSLDVPEAPTVADAGIAVATGSVDGSGDPSTTASASNLEAALAHQAVPDLLAVADQKAPRDHLSPESATSVPGEIPGVASLDVSTSTAHARWTGDRTCSAPGAALTSSSVSTADLATARAPRLGTLLALPGTASTSQRTVLAGTGEPGVRKVVSTVDGSAADLRLLDGQVGVQVADAPTLRASATGTPGGAGVDWNAPAVTVTVAGERQTLPADGSPVDVALPDNSALHVELSVGQPSEVVEAPDGTSASAEAHVLHVKATLGAPPLTATVLEVDLFPLSASAVAPKGGVDCGTASGDSDSDGLTDAEETSGSANDGYGNQPTDPDQADSDGDGLTDGEELSGSANDAYGHAPTDPNSADTDGDGLGDGPETSGAANAAFGGAATDPTAGDTDGDGLGDGREVGQTSTDPTNPDTDSGTVSDGDEVTAGTNPLDPTDDVSGGGPGGPGGPGEPGDPGSPGSDIDGDGLSDTEELGTGTNPAVADTDDDGLTDGDEVDEHETTPTDPDTDGDRLTDGREVERTDTKPKVKDTDHDGLNDGHEVLQVKTAPKRKDTDRDGLGDGREVKRLKTDPKRKDTDKDGLWDGREVFGPAPKRYPSCETDPTRADSDKDGLKDGRELKRTDTNPCDKDSDDGGASDGNEVKAGSDPNDPHSTPKNPRANTSLGGRLFGPTG